MFLFKLLILVSILFLIHFFAIAPNRPRSSQRSPFLKCHYAHRGLFSNTKLIPENSLTAFNLAVCKGYGIELDVHLTADNQLVVFHDNTLDRMCGRSGIIHKMTYDELKSCRLLETNETIPLFKDVLTLVDGKVPLLIELKCERLNTKICTYVNNELLNYKGLYCIESFNPLLIRWYKKNRPDVIRGQLSGGLIEPVFKRDFIVRILLTHLFFNFLSRPDFVSYSHYEMNNLSLIINRKFFRAATFAWTVRTIEDYEKSKGAFDAIIFDRFDPPAPIPFPSRIEDTRKRA